MTADTDSRREMQQAAQDGSARDVVGEDVAPLAEGLVAGDALEYAGMSSAELAVSAFAKPPTDLVKCGREHTSWQ